MNYKTILFAPLLSILSSSASSQTNWSDMGEYWEPRLPKLMLSLEDESRLCKKNEKQKGDKQPCMSKVLIGAKLLTWARDGEVKMVFADEELYRKAHEIFEDQARKDGAWKYVSAGFDPRTSFSSKSYFVFCEPGLKRIGISRSSAVEAFDTIKAHREDPVNTWVSVAGMTPGVTTERDFLNMANSRREASFIKIPLEPNLNWGGILYWYSAFYKIKGHFWGLPREDESSVKFGDYNLIDEIKIKCHWDGSFFNKLSAKLTEKYRIVASYKDTWKVFKPKSEACLKYNCPLIAIGKNGEFLEIALKGNQSYIGLENYASKIYRLKRQMNEEKIAKGLNAFN